MSNRPFDREIINPLEKPLADDLNLAQSYHDMSLRFFLGQFLKDSAGAKRDGFIRNGFKVVAASTPDMSVSVSAGLGFQNLVGDAPSAIDSLVGLNDLESYKPIPLFANLALTVPAAPAGPATRIDIIEVRADRITTDPTSRQVFNPGAGEFQADTVNKTLQFAVDGRAGFASAPNPSTEPLSYKVGVAGAPGAVPATTAGYIKIAEIAVGSDVLSITDADISDERVDLATRNIQLQFPASNGFTQAGTGEPEEGGFASISNGGVYAINLGNGLLAGDIIDDIVVVWRDNGVNQTVSSQLFLHFVDLDAGTYTFPFAYSDGNTTTPGSPLDVYEASHQADDPSKYPIVWTGGSVATMRCTPFGGAGNVMGIYMNIRRPVS